MTTHGLLLGRTPFDLEVVLADIVIADVRVSTGTGVKDVAAALASGPVDRVIIGAGTPLPDRLEIVRRR